MEPGESALEGVRRSTHEYGTRNLQIDELDGIASLLKYLTAENALRYVAIVGMFVTRAERFEASTGLTPAEVRVELERGGFDVSGDVSGLSEEQVENDLIQLAKCGNCSYRQDVSAVKTLAEARCRHYRYSLTSSGKTVHQVGCISRLPI